MPSRQRVLLCHGRTAALGGLSTLPPRWRNSCTTTARHGADCPPPRGAHGGEEAAASGPANSGGPGGGCRQQPAAELPRGSGVGKSGAGGGWPCRSRCSLSGGGGFSSPQT